MRLSVLIAILFSVVALSAQETINAEADAAYQKASASIQNDLDAALERLAEVRATIAREKAEIGLETAKTAADLREKRRKADLARLRADDLNHDLRTLAKRVDQWSDERNYINGLLTEFRKQFEADSHPAAAEKMSQLFAASEGTDQQSFAARATIAEQAIENFSAIRGPETIAGEALDTSGTSHDGRFLIVGPVSWFLSDDGKVSGLTDAGDGLQPRIIPGTANNESIAKVANGTGDLLEFDPTLGAAVAIKQADGTLLDHLRQGGLWIWPILFLALVATIAAIAKWWQLLRIRDLTPATIQKVLVEVNNGNRDAGMTHLHGNSHPAAAIIRRGVELSDGTHSRDAVEEALYEKFLAAQPSLQRGLPLIAIASASAPLLGLLGTVTGMIHTFKLINIFGTGDAKSLASGISEALITTEFGLIVAIPALILHALLSRKVQGIKSTMEMSSLAFLNGLQKVTDK